MKFQIFKQKFKSEEYIFFGVAIFTLSVIAFRIYSQYGCNIKTNILFLVLIVIFLPLIFLAYKDFKTFEVDHYTSLILLTIFALLNIILFLVKGNTFEIPLTEKLAYLPYQNLLGGVTLGAIFQLLVLLTKEKGLGQGDVRIAIISGLLVGFDGLIPWLYITIFSSLLYGIIIAIKRRKFRGLKIPFVPFMVFGVVLQRIVHLFCV